MSESSNIMRERATTCLYTPEDQHSPDAVKRSEQRTEAHLRKEWLRKDVVLEHALWKT